MIRKVPLCDKNRANIKSITNMNIDGICSLDLDLLREW
nr:MAG TPA: hypothetical protein [Caudoviricetes sp.]